MLFFSQPKPGRTIMKIELEALPPEPKRRLTNDEYNFIYGDQQMGRVPRICVDALIVSDGKIMLAKRNIEPFKGYWALPGGAINFGETIDEALNRNLKKELGINPVAKRLIGNIEHYPDGPYKHSISMVYVVKFTGQLKAKDQADELQFFSEVPEHTQTFQGKFLQENWAAIIAAAASL